MSGETPTDKSRPAEEPTRSDRAEWAAFVRRYGPVILAWCREIALPEPDVHPATQALLRALYPEFARRQAVAMAGPELRQSLRNAVQTTCGHVLPQLAGRADAIESLAERLTAE